MRLHLGSSDEVVERRHLWGSGGQAMLTVGGSIPNAIASVCCEAV